MIRGDLWPLWLLYRAAGIGRRAWKGKHWSRVLEIGTGELGPAGRMGRGGTRPETTAKKGVKTDTGNRGSNSSAGKDVVLLEHQLHPPFNQLCSIACPHDGLQSHVTFEH